MADVTLTSLAPKSPWKAMIIPGECVSRPRQDKHVIPTRSVGAAECRVETVALSQGEGRAELLNLTTSIEITYHRNPVHLYTSSLYVVDKCFEPRPGRIYGVHTSIHPVPSNPFRSRARGPAGDKKKRGYSCLRPSVERVQAKR